MNISEMYENLKKDANALADESSTQEKDDSKDELQKLIELTEKNEKDQQEASTDASKEISQVIEEQEKKEKDAETEEEGKEKRLDEKLADIEKVISAFGDNKPLGSSGPDKVFGKVKIRLYKAQDFSGLVAKDFVSPFLVQPTSQRDRIALLIDNLTKSNLL